MEEDPLGFTKRTAMVLEGLKAETLIPECKKRNISTDALEKLSRDDLIVLGATEELADKLLKQLRIRKTVIDPEKYSDEEKINKLLEVLKGGRQQLDLLEVFLAYLRKKLLQTPTDFIIDKNNNERASWALAIATKCTIDDLEDLERNYRELSALINEDQEKSTGKPSKLMVKTFVTACILTSLIFIWKIRKQ